jgi:ligand-binding SRPBCC domain-containing protein
MRLFDNKFVVNSSLKEVWAFYTNIRHLEKITPPKINLRILYTTSEEIKEASGTWLTGKIIFGMQWHSRIVAFEQHRYVDEMIISDSEKPVFQYWRHEHVFKGGDSQTIVIDKINFELPYGFIGRVFEAFAVRKLRNVFNYRESATKKQLEMA